METIEQLITKLNGLPEFLKEVSDNTIFDNSSEILDLNKEQLLVRGIGYDGNSLGEYRPITKRIRAKKGKQTNHIDLKDTGAFQNSFELLKTGEAKAEIDAKDPKWTSEIEGQEFNLQDRYPSALGLDLKSEEDLTKILIKNIEHQLNNYL